MRTIEVSLPSTLHEFVLIGISILTLAFWPQLLDWCSIHPTPRKPNRESKRKTNGVRSHPQPAASPPSPPSIPAPQ